ncbi:MAG TPA: hypothetical protein VEV15_02960 [Flavisolibacter sp.]|nr:hypothetical protein [Flavisolibacter sp.]
MRLVFVISSTADVLFGDYNPSAKSGNLQWVAEPGEFDLMIGASSSDIKLKAGFELVK